jgi:glycosyltransferase involved in cell wall biosynthesis
MKVLLPRMSTGPGGVKRFTEEMVRQFRLLTQTEPTLVHLHPADWDGGSRTRVYEAWSALQLSSFRQREPTFACFPVGWKSPATDPLVGFVHDLRGPMAAVGSSADRSERLSAVPRLQRMSIRSWDVVCVPSPHVADDVAFLWPTATVECIGEGIDHLPCPPREQSRDSLVVIGGRMPHKRTDLGLDVARKVAKQVAVDHIFVIGQPSDDRVGPDFTTIASDDDWVAALAKARVAIAPSEYEGFGLAVGEALHAGVPVVYAEGSGLEWVVGHAGMATAPAEGNMSEAVLSIWSNGASRALQAKVQVQRFSWRNTAEKALGLLGCSIASDPEGQR